MSTLAESLEEIKKSWQWLAAALVVLMLAAIMAMPNLLRSRMSADEARAVAHQRAVPTEPTVGQYYAPTSRVKPVAQTQGLLETSKTLITTSLVTTPADADAAAGRKIIRTSSMEIVVQHPSETADKITTLAESMGGYVASADGGQTAVTGTLTIRVPAARFEEARVQIRKLGLRVENERINAEDVTRQYVDQDATIRNLRAEEAQYLSILKQATTVKDLLAVSEQLSQVRGQIEQQQAEFNALSKQIETVAIAISLRTEPVPQALGWNWHPGDQLKLALHDGLDSLATYAAAMTAILFYLPAALLWVGTIMLGIVIGWRLLRWVGRRWFGWAEAALNG